MQASPWTTAADALHLAEVSITTQPHQTLSTSLARYQTMVEHAAEGICVGQNGLLCFANAYCLTLLGTDVLCMAAHPMIEYVHPDDRAFVADQQLRRARGERVAAFEARFQRGDGSVSWVEINGVLIEWEGAQANLFFLKDVTERKQLEALTHSAAERYRAVVENVNDAIVVIQQGIIRFSNASAQTLFGKPLTGIPSLHLIHPEDRSLVLERRELMQGGKLVNAYEARFLTPPAETLNPSLRIGWANIYGTRIEWDGAAALLVLMSDISERRQLDERLKNALAQREAILETTAVGVTFLKDRRHQWLNRTLAAMLGYTQAELLGQETRVHYASEEDFEQLGRQAYAQIGATGAFSAEARMQRKDGALIWVQLDGTALSRDHPEEGTVWTYVDVTRRKQADEETRHALERERELGELKTRFVSMASHEFRTPLATILSSAELIEHYGDRINTAERQDIMGNLVVAVKRMQGMLEDMLTVGQADAGRLQLKPGLLNIARLCQLLVAEAGCNDATAHVIRFDCPQNDPVQGPGQFDAVLVDERLIRHILGNLLSNACKYAPANSEVLLRLVGEGNVLVFEVSDSGIGIAPDDLPRLFESFYRGTNVGNRPGSGLGLAIVKRSVDLHRGSIGVASTVGTGSVFTVRIPVLGDHNSQIIDGLQTTKSDSEEGIKAA